MFHHLFNFHYLHNVELDELYAFLGLHAVGLALSSVFVPLYLWEIGYALWEIFTFFAIVSLSFIVFTYVSLPFIRGRGHRALLIASVPCISAALYGLTFLPTHPWLFFVLPLGLALNLLLFNTAYHMNLAHVAKEGSIGKEIGMQYIVLGLAKSVAPFMGAVIADVFSFEALFWTSIAFLFASIIPVWTLPSTPLSTDLSLRGLTHAITDTRQRTFMWIQAGHGANFPFQLILWPLFLFIIVGNLEVFGAMLSIAALVAMVVQYLDGVAIDAGRRKVMATLSGMSYTLSAFGQAVVGFFPIPVFAGVVNTIHTTAQGAAFVGFAQETMHHTKAAANPGGFSLSYTLVWHLTRLCVFMLLAALAYVMPFMSFFIVAFSLGALITLSFLLLNKL